MEDKSRIQRSTVFTWVTAKQQSRFHARNSCSIVAFGSCLLQPLMPHVFRFQVHPRNILYNAWISGGHAPRRLDPLVRQCKSGICTCLHAFGIACELHQVEQMRSNEQAERNARVSFRFRFPSVQGLVGPRCHLLDACFWLRSRRSFERLKGHAAEVD